MAFARANFLASREDPTLGAFVRVLAGEDETMSHAEQFGLDGSAYSETLRRSNNNNLSTRHTGFLHSAMERTRERLCHHRLLPSAQASRVDNRAAFTTPCASFGSSASHHRNSRRGERSS